MTATSEIAPAHRAERHYRLGRRPELDGVRGLAILLVLWNHTALPYSGTSGTMGVVVFFVLSGFLITRLLLEECEARGTIQLRGFYVRRALRLFPAMAAYLGVTTFIALRYSEPLNQIYWSGLYVMNVVRSYYGEYVTLAPHTWSLAMEEQFYLVWPLVLVFLLVRKRASGPVITWIVIASLVASLAYRWGLVAANTDLQRLHNDPFAVAFCLLAGCLLALTIGQFNPPRWVGAVVVLASVALLLVCSVQEKSVETYSVVVPLVTVASFFLVAALAGDGQLPQWLRAVFTFSVLRYLGRISYGLYLWHYSVYYVVKHELAGHQLATTWVKPGLQVGISIVVAIASYHLIEKRFLRLKERTR